MRPVHYIFLLFTMVLFMACGQKPKSAEPTVEETESVDSTSIGFLSDEIRDNPGNANLFAARAEIYFQSGNTEEALRDMGLAIKLDSLNPQYYISIAEYYLSTGKSEKSKEFLDICVEHFPENVDGILKLAEIHFLVQQYKEAMEFIVKAQQLDPLLAQPFFLKGLIYKEAGDTLKAIENFQITVNKDPDQYHAYMLLGAIFSDREDSLALDYFRIALKLQPGSIEAWYGIGMFYQQSTLFTHAINAYQTIIDSIDADYEFAHYNIGYIYLHGIKDYKMALLHFTNTIEIKNNYYQAWYNRGYTFEKMEDYNSARSDYKAALNILPNYELSIEGLNRIDRLTGK
jgi:tetratricopeptide (TPR) repeat protein